MGWLMPRRRAGRYWFRKCFPGGTRASGFALLQLNIPHRGCISASSLHGVSQVMSVDNLALGSLALCIWLFALGSQTWFLRSALPVYQVVQMQDSGVHLRLSCTPKLRQ